MHMLDSVLIYLQVNLSPKAGGGEHSLFLIIRGIIYKAL